MMVAVVVSLNRRSGGGTCRIRRIGRLLLGGELLLLLQDLIGLL
jgi:hypothetical protein